MLILIRILQDLKKVIAGENSIDLSYDFDNNGDIDVFDLVKMKNYIINEDNSGGETVTSEYSASEKYVKFMGRYFTDKIIQHGLYRVVQRLNLRYQEFLLKLQLQEIQWLIQRKNTDQDMLYM